MRARLSRRLALGAFLALAAVALWFAALGTRGVTSVKLMIVGFSTNEIGGVAVIQLTNAGPRSIAYYGGEANQPYYSYSFDTPTGPTNFFPSPDARPEKFVLGARQSVEFKAQTMVHGPYRIILYYAPTSPMDRLDSVDWTIPPRWVAWVANRLRGPRHHPVSTPPLNGRPEDGS